jgi:hypothetical protein
MLAPSFSDSDLCACHLLQLYNHLLSLATHLGLSSKALPDPIPLVDHMWRRSREEASVKVFRMCTTSAARLLLLLLLLILILAAMMNSAIVAIY